MGPPRLTLVPKDPAADATRSQEETGDRAASDADVPAGARPASEAPPTVAEGEGRDTPLAHLAAGDLRERLRIVEAILFASPAPLDETEIARHLGGDDDVAALVRELQETYTTRGINLVRVAGKWAFRTADDLSFLLQRFAHEERKLSKAALETLSIIAYHQPVTRAEIEEIRGVTTSSGTIDILLETGWIRPRGRRRAPGRPLTFGTTETFLTHFGLDTIKDLPGLAELKGAGLLDSTLPAGFTVPEPRDVAALMPDELPLDSGDEDEDQGSLALEDEEDEEAVAAETDDGERPAAGGTAAREDEAAG